MRRIVLAAIRTYQRYISPYKGFCCAYRMHTGRASCSTLGYRAVRRRGVLAGFAILRQRTFLCGVAHRRHAPAHIRPPAGQRGDCDLACDLPCDSSCDMPSGDVFSRVCDGADFCDCGSCDWPDRKKRKSGKDEYIHIPPSVAAPGGQRRE